MLKIRTLALLNNRRADTVPFIADQSQGVRESSARVIAIDHYGASAPSAEVMKKLGFTAEHVAALRVFGPK